MKEQFSKSKSIILSLTLFVFCFAPVLAESNNPADPDFEGHVYVAPSAYQSLSQNIYSSLGLTNLTEYWFNVHIYFVDSNGEIVRRVSPLLKGFGTWQRSTLDLLPEDFQGSVWIVSDHPIVSSAFIHRSSEDGNLVLLGTVEIKQVDPGFAGPLMTKQEESVLQDF